MEDKSDLIRKFQKKSKKNTIQYLYILIGKLNIEVLKYEKGGKQDEFKEGMKKIMLKIENELKEI